MGEQNSEEEPEQGEEQQASEQDPIQNVKAEMDRKLSKTQQKTEDMQQKLDQIVNHLAQQQQQSQASAQPVSESEEEDLSDLIYSDPEKYARLVREQAKKEATQEAVSETQKAQQQEQYKQQVMGRLIGDFPELNDQENDFTKDVYDRIAQLPENKRGDPDTWKSVVYEAAVHNGLAPSNRRSQAQEGEFTGVKQKQGMSSRPQKGKSKEDAATEVQKEFLRYLGEDAKKYEGKLKKANQRRNWSRSTPIDYLAEEGE